MKPYCFYNQRNDLIHFLNAETEHVNNLLTVNYLFHKQLEFDELPTKSAFIDHSDMGRELGLWESTCFELFIQKNQQSPKAQDYYEVNFSPLRKKWNAFYFEYYRSPISPTSDIEFLEASVSERSIKLTLKIPEGDYQFHPKVILVNKNIHETLYLSNQKHPSSGPDFHVFLDT